MEPVDSMHFDGTTKVVHMLVQEELVKYVSYYTSTFNELAET